MTPRSGADALRAAVLQLRQAGVEDAPRDARLLLACAMGLASDRMTLHLADHLTPAAEAALPALIAARARRQPMAQILGQRLFWGHAFEVTRDTLDPRPDTEILVEAALSQPFTRMLDLGTGTGCILISCLLDRPGATGLGTDLSPAALQVAARNIAWHGLGTRARLAQGHWWDAAPGRFDLIVSNPPYIAADEMPHLAPEVLDHEPHLALTPGGDGLDACRAIAAGALAHLTPGGRILLEIGPTQGAAVQALLAAQGFTGLTVLPDLDGRPRVVAGQGPAAERGDFAT